MRLATLVVGLLLVGCGPMHSAHMIKRSTKLVDNAAEVGAGKYARYEMTKAGEYLHQARLKRGHGQYEIAEIWAEKAGMLAVEARRLALQRKNLERLRKMGRSQSTRPAAIRKRRVRKKKVRSNQSGNGVESRPAVPRRRSFRPPSLKRESGGGK